LNPFRESALQIALRAVVRNEGEGAAMDRGRFPSAAELSQ
jgi:hypothetical protein